MAAAVTAARRGHDVILCEKSGVLGGVINYSRVDTLKTDLLRYRNYIVRQTEKCAADIRLNTEVTVGLIENEAPDHLIVATGAESIIPVFLKGYENGIDIIDMYDNPELIKGEDAVIIGGGLSGVEAGIFLAGVKGKNVTVLEKFKALSAVGRSYGWGVDRGIKESGINIIEYADCEEILPDGVRYVRDGTECFAKADTVIFAVGRRSSRSLYFAAAGKVPFIDIIGDSREVGQLRGAISTGWAAAMDIGNY